MAASGGQNVYTVWYLKCFLDGSSVEKTCPDSLLFKNKNGTDKLKYKIQSIKCPKKKKILREMTAYMVYWV